MQPKTSLTAWINSSNTWAAVKSFQFISTFQKSTYNRSHTKKHLQQIAHHPTQRTFVLHNDTTKHTDTTFLAFLLAIPVQFPEVTTHKLSQCQHGNSKSLSKTAVIPSRHCHATITINFTIESALMHKQKKTLQGMASFSRTIYLVTMIAILVVHQSPKKYGTDTRQV